MNRDSGTRVRFLVFCAAAGALAGCATVEPHLMPTPVLFKDERLDFAPRLPPELRSTRLSVFYATPRAPAGEGQPGHYVNDAGDGTRLGVAGVRLGALDWSWNDLLVSDRTNTDLTPQELERLAADPRFQVIDVSDVRGAHEMGGMRGHGYWYANEWISTDVTISLRHAIPPEQRCLVNPPGKQRVWEFPENYPQCLADRLLAAFPELRRSK